MYVPPHLRNKNQETISIMPITNIESNTQSWLDKIKITKQSNKKKTYPYGYMVFEKKNNITTIVQDYPTIKSDIQDNLYVMDRHKEYDIEDTMKDLTDGCIDNHNYDNEIQHQEWLYKIDTEWDVDNDDSADESDSLCDSDLDYEYEEF